MLLLVALLSTFAAADPGSKTQGKEKIEVTKNQIKVTVESGFHLNKEAPAQLKIDGAKATVQPLKKEEQLFQFPTPQESGQGTLEFYVCDDAKTVCESHSHPVQWGKGTAQNREKSASLDWQKDFDLGLKQAQEQKKYAIVDFSTRWCPACIRMETETFTQKTFQKIKSQFVLIHIDGDLESNHDLMNRYNIKAYPTLIATDAKGKEFFRTLDFQEALPLTENLKNAVAQLSKKAGDTPSMSIQKAEQFASALDFESAIFWYEKSLGVRYQQARIDLWDDKVWNDKKNKDYVARYQEALKAAIAQWPEVFPSMNWRISLASSLGESTSAAKDVLKELISLSDRWIADPSLSATSRNLGLFGEVAGFEMAEIFNIKGNAQKMLGDNDGAKRSHTQAVLEMQKLNPDESKPTQLFYLASYLKDLDRLNEIQEIYTRLEKYYPSEFIYPERHARVLLDSHLPDQALPLAKRAFELAEGNRKFVIGLLIGKIHVEQKKKTEARAFLKELLATPQSQLPRNANIVKRINDYVKEM